MAQTHRLNVTLDPERAIKLSHLAQRTHVQEGTLARSLLSQAIDAADPEAGDIVAALDGIPGAHERARRGLEEARAGRSVPLADL
jgi:predicted transcriptional regulator